MTAKITYKDDSIELIRDISSYNSGFDIPSKEVCFRYESRPNEQSFIKDFRIKLKFIEIRYIF